MAPHCRVYKLAGPITQADLDWMYNSGIDIHVEDPYEKGDSGWCDATTGQQIITPKHLFTALVMNDEQNMWLKLYWEDRAQLVSVIHSTTIKYKEMFGDEQS